ncbi:MULTISPECIES: DNA helicase [unclassified Actinomyces]|uniref:DNA helicase n=1 Tax=unclassified Actinomyces TaxID=2609248 RepID=UPI002017D791|nr:MULTISPECIES: DNA helicase [unclassified Actinomyces]MCL3778100.1 DNA helicase [Actinomyces sp. AC-20-1]MCL3789821.1 DNA helicase [Actinomyces sp. 187325]MCL3792435.1 DNA helicase [Actinomyces sp. 186855]MCL3794699.1 DNA helicase [Actinomyces sp. 217892]
MTPSLFSFGRNRRETAASQDVPEGTTASAPAHDAPAEATAPPVPAPLSARSQAVEEALATWRQELVDLGGVASLDDITLLDGVVDLTAAHPSGIAQLYAGRATLLSSLVRERSALGVARQSLREVAGRTDLLARQFGVAPVYLAIGVASWTQVVEPDGEGPVALGPSDGDRAAQAPGPAGDGDEPAAGSEDAPADDADAEPAPGPLTRSINAPVLLRPVRLAATSTDTAITLDPSVELNPVLTRALREAGSSADVEALARASLSAEGFTPRAALTRIGALGRELLTDFVVHERLVIGAFVHPGQALVEDFDATLERSRASALVAALAGDEPARQALDVVLPPARLTDRAPERERGAGDLDVAQLAAVEAVSSGASILLDAPPGSDVAATLAAVVADAAASGRTVLHVPATSADGHAVADALGELGLGGLVLDLTEDPAWRRHAAEAIKESLGAQPPELDVAAIVDLRERLTALRERLTGSVDALHEVRQPWDVSAYEALQQLAELTSGRARTRTTARVAGHGLPRLDEAGRERARTLLHRAHSLGVLSRQSASSAWNGLTVTDIDEATDALTRLSRLADDLLPSVLGDVVDAASTTGMTRATTLAEWMEQLEVLDSIRDSLDVFVPEVFERSAADMVIATATKQWREERSLQMTASDRRRFSKQAKDLVRPGRAVGDLHAELVKVQHSRERWRSHHPDGGWPRLPQHLDVMEDCAAQARQALEELQPLFGTAADAPVLIDLDLDELLTRVRALADDDVTAQKLPEVNRVVGELGELGLAPLLADLAERGVPDEELDAELTYCWWASLLSRLLREDPRLAGLDTGALAERAEALRDLDTMQVDTLPGPVGQAWADRVHAAVEADKEQARSLYVALSREDGVPLREILAHHPVAMVAKPVWIVPPTLVPQVLDPQAVVDLAVLDASAPIPVSQVLPAFVRAEQVLVVGDPRRATSGLASELGPLLPSVTLPTTRNTLDAEIAAFLARNGYEDVVEAVPAPPGASGLSLDLVDGRGMPAPGQTAVESVPAEVERVVDLVIEHALTRPEESLGVVALNPRHAEELRRATTAAAAGSPALEGFFAGGVAEPFVVVDLSEARSLRRDHVIISVGYAKTPHGRTIHSFGAVSGAGGMVGLVEALCASRGTTQVVSSLGAEDIDPDRLHSPGSRLLREVLVRAAGQGVEEAQAQEQSPDRLLVDLAEQLWRKGLTVVPRYGLEGGVRIPLAIGHPDYPGELFVAVLTDDADYVAERSLRRRDRHWVERLRRRGWRVHMAFSVSLFVDAEAEAAAIEEQVLAVLSARAEAAAPVVAAVPARVEDADALPGEDGVGGQDGGEAGEPVRGLRPPIAQGLPLQAYSDDQLDDLVAWIRSDGVEREEAEEVEELRATLGLLRRGSGIDAVLANAVRRSRA